MTLAVEALTTAALLLAWCGLGASAPPEGRLLPAVLLAAMTCYHLGAIRRGTNADANRRLSVGRWWGPDAALRRKATTFGLGGAAALAVWAIVRAGAGSRLGGYGSLLVLVVVIATAAKLAAETYLFAQLGAEPSPRQRSAQAMIGPRSGWAKLRYALGALGGIVLPLGAQILAGGAKNIPAVLDAGPPAVLAVVALACLVPADSIERWLFWSGAEEAAPAAG